MRFAAVACSSAVLLSSAAHAQQLSNDQRTTAALNWVRMPGAESCVSPQALARATEARMARRVFVSIADASLSIEGRIERVRAPDGWRAVIRAARAAGEVGSREVRVASPDCAAIDERVVVVVALLLDIADTAPQSAGSATRAQPDATRDPVDARVVPRDAPRASVAPGVSQGRAAPRAPVRVVRAEPLALRPGSAVLSMHLGVWNAIAHATAFGGGLGLRWPNASTLAFDGAISGFVVPRSVESIGEIFGGHFRGGLAVTPGPTWFSVVPSVLVGLERDLSMSNAPTLAWLGLELRGSATVALSDRWALGLAGGLTALVYAPRWVTGSGLLTFSTVASTPPVSGFVELAVLRSL